MDDDQGLYCASFDGSTWSAQASLPGNTGQDLPQNIGVKMQYQETSQWCWMAVATSIALFYDSTSNASQCGSMTTVGQSINGWPATTVCCPDASMLAANPGLGATMADPYTTAAEGVLDNVGIPAVCIKSGGVNDSLAVHNNSNGWRNTLTLEQITAELNGGRPVCADITWPSGSQHVVAIAGVLNDLLVICDPVYGDSVVQYEQFPATYKGGATLNAYCLTKAH